MKAFSSWRSGVALLVGVFVVCLAGCCLVPADGVDNNGDGSTEQTSVAQPL